MKEKTGETYSSWPDVVGISDDGEWRIAVSRDSKPATQWLLQKRRRNNREQWDNKAYCQTRLGLELMVRERADRSLLEIIKGLPDRCVQRATER